MRKKTISKINFLGLNLYKRVRVSEKELLTGVKYDNDFLLGLYPLVKYPMLEFDYISLYKQKDWDKTASELFYKAFLHLFFLDAIKIFKFNDKKRILFGLINLNYQSYYIKLNGSIQNEDVILNLLLRSIYELEKKHREKSDLKLNIKYLIDEFLGSNNNQYNNPEKKFITRLIKRYTQKYNWVELEKESKFLGLISKYKVRIDQVKLRLLNESFRLLSDFSVQEKINNVEIGRFEKVLSNIVEKDFKRRYPSDDHDD